VQGSTRALPRIIAESILQIAKEKTQTYRRARNGGIIADSRETGVDAAMSGSRVSFRSFAADQKSEEHRAAICFRNTR